MNKSKRIVALILVVAAIFTLLSVCAFADSWCYKTKTGRNVHATVVTGKSPWYTHAKVTITNIGSTPMYWFVEKDGKLWKQSTLSSGKSATISLRDNQEFDIYWTGNPNFSPYARGELEAVQYIKSLK